MRATLVSQPVTLLTAAAANTDSSSSYWCWNGELYQSLDDDCAHAQPSDTTGMAEAVQQVLLCDNNNNNNNNIEQRLAKLLGGCYNAEFAYCLVTPDAVYYGRDVWGRRSLLEWQCPDCRSFQIVSVAEMMPPGAEWTEIVPGQVHVKRFPDDDDDDDSFSTSHVDYPKVIPPLPVMPTCLMMMSPPPDGVSLEQWKASWGLEYHLRRAVAMRLGTLTAILFSGGLDSAVLAALAAQETTTTAPLHLYNVSFGKASADRQAALRTYREVFQVQYSHVHYHDVLVSSEHICQHEPHIRTLLQPKSTLMDVNIATALWFASWGRSEDTDDDQQQQQQQQDDPRVLLLGMGADEQMGGYGRHRKAFARGELQQELDMDQARFWERNLGRDDRMCADHGKEARYPFLDAHVVNYLRSLPLELVCDFSLPPGVGDKRILRLVALRLGLDHASGLVKRAIQFGSRISHVSDAKRFGSRRKAKGEANVCSLIQKE